MFPPLAQYLAGSQTAEAFSAEYGISRSQLGASGESHVLHGKRRYLLQPGAACLMAAAQPPMLELAAPLASDGARGVPRAWQHESECAPARRQARSGDLLRTACTCREENRPPLPAGLPHANPQTGSYCVPRQAGVSHSRPDCCQPRFCLQTENVSVSPTGLAWITHEDLESPGLDVFVGNGSQSGNANVDPRFLKRLVGGSKRCFGHASSGNQSVCSRTCASWIHVSSNHKVESINPWNRSGQKVSMEVRQPWWRAQRHASC